MGRGADRQDNLNDALARWLGEDSETLELSAGERLEDEVCHSLCLLTDG